MLIPLFLSLAAAPASDTLTLVKAIELGRARTVAAVVARLGSQVAQARVSQRRADLLPNVAGSASLTRQTLNLDEFGIPVAKGVTDPFSLFNFRVRVQQTVFDPAAFSRLAATRDSVAAAGFDATVAGTVAGATAGFAFLRALSADETVAARQADSTLAARLLEQARQLNQVGITAAIDVTRSEGNAATGRAQLAVARNQRDRARLDLVRALDFPADTVLTLATDFGTTATDLPADRELPAFGLAHRGDLMAERQRLIVMERGRQAIRAENLPSVSASGAMTESGRETGALKSTWVAQLGVAIPILDGWRRQFRSREQGLRIEAQALRVKDLEHEIDIQVRQATLDVASAAEQVTLAADRQRLAEREMTQAEERFQAGVAGSIETTTAQSGLVAARDAVIQARVGLSVARVGLYRALGILEQLR